MTLLTRNLNPRASEKENKDRALTKAFLSSADWLFLSYHKAVMDLGPIVAGAV